MTMPKKRKNIEVEAPVPNERQWSRKDLNLLIRLAKQCQKLGSQGIHGDWKTYLKAWKPLSLALPCPSTSCCTAKALLHVARSTVPSSARRTQGSMTGR